MAEAKVTRSRAPCKPVVIVCADCGIEVLTRASIRKRCEPCSDERRKRKNRRSARQWELDNPERCSPEAKRQRRLDNLEAFRARERENYKKNRERILERAKEHYRRNRRKILARMATPEGREYAATKMRERLQDNPQFRLHSNISRAVRNGLAGKGRRRWEDLVGYTAAQLKEHLERQFARGMGWHNYGRGSGKWHIDHIVPQSAFTFSSPDDPEFRACWALTNLRPLWGDKNISKHASREFLI